MPGGASYLSPSGVTSSPGGSMSDPSPKEQILAAVERLPADATLEDVIDSLLFLHKAQIGLAQADAGQVTPHSEVKKRLGL